MKKILPVVLLLLAVFVLYAQTIGFGLLRYDDPDYTIACAFVKDGFSWANVRAAFANFRHGGIWMPLTYLSYMSDITFLGGSPAAFHLTNVLLHAANALLLWLLLESVLGVNSVFSVPRAPKAPKDPKAPIDPIDPKDPKTPAAFLLFAATAFWALHPQRVEAVAWVAARKELLWTFFALIGLLCWRRGSRFAATLAMALACLSKPTAMVFPFLAFALDLAVSQRKGAHRTAHPSVMQAYSCAHPSVMQASRLHALRPYLPLLALSLATGLIAVYSQTHPEGMAAKELFYAPLGHRLVNAVNAVGLYLAQTLVPVGIHLDYRSVTDLLPLGWPVGLPLGVVVIGFIVSLVSIESLAFLKHSNSPKTLKPLNPPEPANSLKALKTLKTLNPPEPANSLKALKTLKTLNPPEPLNPLKTLKTLKTLKPLITLGTLWMLCGLLPTLGIFGSFGEQARADRFWYLPSMALSLGLAVGIGACSRRARAGVCTTGLAVLAGVFASVAFCRVGDYRNDRTVFERTEACDPENGRALAHVGEARCAAGDLDGGIDLLRRSRTNRPRFDTDAKLAYALMRRGRSEDLREIRTVCAAVAADPVMDEKGQALEALGTAELAAGEWKAAATHLARSVVAPKRFYSAADAQLKLAFALHNCGRRAEATRLFEALYRSTRRDLAERASQALLTLAEDPLALLFW